MPPGSLLRGADEIGLRKPVKAEFGGGMRSFSCEEDYIYENIENELYFFTSQVGARSLPLQRAGVQGQAVGLVPQTRVLRGGSRG